MPRKINVDTEELMTSGEVAKRLHVSLSQIKRMRSGRYPHLPHLPTIYIGGAARIPKSAVDDILRGDVS